MRDKYSRQDFNSYNLMHKPADSSLWKAIVALWPYLVDDEVCCCVFELSFLVNVRI